MFHLAGIELTGTSRSARVKNAKSHPGRYVTERIAGSARVEVWGIGIHCFAVREATATRHQGPSRLSSRFEFCSDQTVQVVVIQRITRGGKAHTEDMAGTERLKPPAMFVPIKEGFQRKSDQSQKENRCQTKRSMSCGAENRSRYPLLNLSAPLRPRRDASLLLLCPACRSPLAHQALNARNQCLCARVTGGCFYLRNSFFAPPVHW